MLNILSLGAGVQSSVVFLMSCKGVLPKLDGAIFADTGWEPPAVYEWLKTVLEPAGLKADIPIHRCSKGNLRKDALRSSIRVYDKDEGGRWASMPLYTKGTSIDGSEGRLRRQCTKEYKIEPVHTMLRMLNKGKKGEPVRLWFGISADEKRRMRISKVGWLEHYYPLIFGLDHPLHRHDCLRWLDSNGFPVAPRSACLGCPYHNNQEWRDIQRDPVLWRDVVEFDAAIRGQGLRGAIKSEAYLHRSCKPLPMIDFSTPEERGQQNWLNECEGMCGV